LKISLEVMKLVYLHTTYVLSLLIIGQNITCTKFRNLWISTRRSFYLYTIWTRHTTRAKWWNTCIESQHLAHLFAYYSKTSSAWRKAQTRNVMDMTPCSLGKFLVVPTFVTRLLQICKATRDPSGERWNYLSRRLFCNFAQMTAITPFRYLILNLQTCIGTN